VRAVRVVAPALVLAGLLTACGSGDRARPATAEPAALRVLVIGDSLTEMDSPDFDAGRIGATSWAAIADGDGIDIAGGWAHGGATTADMLAGVRRVTRNGAAPLVADVVVLMAGNNDLEVGGSFAAAGANLRAVVELIRAPRVVLSAIAPENGLGAEIGDFNAQLPGLARSAGWEFVDPMTGIRAADGQWLPGMSDDGVHPDAAAARLIGHALRAVLSRGR
jgi:lysophospholipase L1-like esterase